MTRTSADTIPQDPEEREPSYNGEIFDGSPVLTDIFARRDESLRAPKNGVASLTSTHHAGTAAATTAAVGGMIRASPDCDGDPHSSPGRQLKPAQPAIMTQRAGTTTGVDVSEPRHTISSSKCNASRSIALPSSRHGDHDAVVMDPLSNNTILPQQQPWPSPPAPASGTTTATTTATTIPTPGPQQPGSFPVSPPITPPADNTNDNSNGKSTAAPSNMQEGTSKPTNNGNSGAGGGGGGINDDNIDEEDNDNDGKDVSDSNDGRVRVLCRFRRFLDPESEWAAQRSGWLHFDGPTGGGGGGRGDDGLDSVSVRLGSTWSRRRFDKIFRPGVDQQEVKFEKERLQYYYYNTNCCTTVSLLYL